MSAAVRVNSETMLYGVTFSSIIVIAVMSRLFSTLVKIGVDPEKSTLVEVEVGVKIYLK